VPALGVTGNTVFDVSGLGNHASLSNMDPATDWIISTNPRMPGYALDFDGSNDSLEIPHHDRYNVAGGPLSVFGWMTTSDTNGELMGKDRDSLPRWYLERPNSARIQLRINDGTDELDVNWNHNDDGLNFADGFYHHVGFVYYGGGKGDLFYDGISRLTGTNSLVGDFDNAHPVSMAGRVFQPAPLTSTGASMLMWDRALTDAEVWLLYQVPLAPLVLRSRMFVKAPEVDISSIGQLSQSGGMIGMQWM